MQVTTSTLAAIAGASANSNMASVIEGLKLAGVGAGLERPHRLAMYLGQLAHESAGFRYDREIWGPTSAQKRYDGRRDLGNTQPGDGYKFRGRGPIQITGRYNTTAFRDWSRKIDAKAPDFVANPDLINTDPWEGLGPIWYWDSRSLNRHADAGDYLTVTKRINGGTNGLADRQARYTRAALVLLGRSATDVKGFQRAAGLPVDGKPGPNTRAALHRALAKLPPVSFGPAAPASPSQPQIPASGPAATVVVAAIVVVIALIVMLKG